MNNLKVTTLSLVAIAAISFTGCGGSSSAPAAVATPNCDASYSVLPSDINTNLTLDKTKVYGLDGKVKVTNSAVLNDSCWYYNCWMYSFIFYDSYSRF
ncbi:MAG: hypothetical protein Q9M40_09880 [Sulfurimonas sp.]|nr:hypothetical protein [Sulfurimonas sp.]